MLKKIRNRFAIWLLRWRLKRIFKKLGLNLTVNIHDHIVNANKDDEFWPISKRAAERRSFNKRNRDSISIYLDMFSYKEKENGD